jgi:hypothetical protein
MLVRYMGVNRSWLTLRRYLQAASMCSIRVSLVDGSGCWVMLSAMVWRSAGKRLLKTRMMWR